MATNPPNPPSKWAFITIENPALRRAVRTFFQGFIGVLAGSTVLTLIASKGTIDVDALQTVLISAVGGGLIALVAYIQNALEDKTGTDLIVKK